MIGIWSHTDVMAINSVIPVFYTFLLNLGETWRLLELLIRCCGNLVRGSGEEPGYYINSYIVPTLGTWSLGKSHIWN